MKASTWLVQRRAVEETRATATQAPSTTSAASQPLPLTPMLRGRGGGAPVGRRRRRARASGEAATVSARLASAGPPVAAPERTSLTTALPGSGR